MLYTLSMLSKILLLCHCVWRQPSFSSPYQSWRRFKIVLRIDRKRTRESFFICFYAISFLWFDGSSHTIAWDKTEPKNKHFFFLLRISPLRCRMWEEEVFCLKNEEELKTKNQNKVFIFKQFLFFCSYHFLRVFFCFFFLLRYPILSRFFSRSKFASQ